MMCYNFRPVTDPLFEDVNNAFERALVFMHKVRVPYKMRFEVISKQQMQEAIFIFYSYQTLRMSLGMNFGKFGASVL